MNMNRTLYTGPATTITLEASLEVIHRQDLDTLNGEQFDHIKNAIRVVDTGAAIIIESTRSVEAWHRDEPNAGRGTWEFPYATLASIRVDGAAVWTA
jgi:hypothetical protein